MSHLTSAKAKWALPGLALLAVTACAQDGPAVELGGQRFLVEIADSPEEQQLGLMFRDHLDVDAGMLFVNGDERPRAFHMRNCRIPLDIIFFDADLELVNVHENAQPCRRGSRCPTYRSTGPAQYVLELNGGTFSRLGLEQDARLVLDLE